MKKTWLSLMLLLVFSISANAFAATETSNLQTVISEASTDDLLMLRELIDAELERRYEAIKSIKEDETTYILNTNSRKFHIPSCDSAIRTKEKNKKDFTGDREDLIDMGYTPCGVCNP